MAETLTRKSVAKLLGVSIATVRRLEEAGTLTPDGADGEERRFDPAQVERVRVARLGARAANAEADVADDGELEDEAEDGGLDEDPDASRPDDAGEDEPVSAPFAAMVFRELRDGMTPIDIVATHGVEPEVVIKLVEQYRTLDELASCVPNMRQRIETLEKLERWRENEAIRMRRDLEHLEWLLGSLADLEQSVRAAHETAMLVRSLR